MLMYEIEKEMMLGMISILNQASEAYYSGNPIMSDAQFDMRLKDLQELERETGVVFSNSPTINVGAKVLTELPEVIHNHFMLSLEKVHTTEELVKFANNKELVASIKLDGLTLSLLYEDGKLTLAETRGNGYVGNNVTEHVKRFKNVPLTINKTGTYVIDGEAIISDEDFAEVNKNGEYKNSRNLAAGTLSSLDTSVVSQRKLQFVLWDVIEGGNNSLKDNLTEAKELGFSVVPYWSAINLDPKKLQNTIDYVYDYAIDEGLPCDGIVFKFNDIEYGKSLGKTEHHFKNGVAYKKEDEVYKTELLDVEWTMGKTGVLTPTSVFKPVEIDGTTVERASAHNVSILEDLCLCIGDTIEVFKANQIIPQIKRNISAEQRQYIEAIEAPLVCIPSMCPICLSPTEIKQDNNSKVLVCTNDNCKGRLLGKLTHFVSKNAMNIEGLSEATLEKFIDFGWLTKFIDIYHLNVNRVELMQLEGFGEKSVRKLLDSIEKSKTTTLDRFIYALSIPLIGKSASKTIAKYCEYDVVKFINSYVAGVDWTILNDFGENMSNSIKNYIAQNSEELIELCECLNFVKPEGNNDNNKLSNKTFCITGSLTHFTNREELQKVIESAGGKVVNNVSTKTAYLINNDAASTSSKNKKAIELNIPIISEDELIEMLNK